MVAFNLLYVEKTTLKRIQLTNEACFARLQAAGGHIHWYEDGKDHSIDRDKGDKLTSIRYFPALSKLIDKASVDRFFAELREAMPELPWGVYDFAHWRRYGISVNMTKYSGPAVIGLFSAIRYPDEYPSAITRYFLLRDVVGLDVLPAFFMMHNFSELDSNGKNWEYISSCGGGHAMLSGKTMYEVCYKHFVHKKWVPVMTDMKPFSESWNYLGIQDLFCLASDTYKTGFSTKHKPPPGLIYGSTLDNTELLVTIANNWSTP
jgi:hypothetical protein